MSFFCQLLSALFSLVCNEEIFCRGKHPRVLYQAQQRWNSDEITSTPEVNLYETHYSKHLLFTSISGSPREWFVFVCSCLIVRNYPCTAKWGIHKSTQLVILPWFGLKLVHSNRETERSGGKRVKIKKKTMELIGSYIKALYAVLEMHPSKMTTFQELTSIICWYFQTLCLLGE